MKILQNVIKLLRLLNWVFFHTIIPYMSIPMILISAYGCSQAYLLSTYLQTFMIARNIVCSRLMHRILENLDVNNSKWIKKISNLNKIKQKLEHRHIICKNKKKSNMLSVLFEWEYFEFVDYFAIFWLNITFHFY